ncbi:MAG: twin-arginine translocation signal domain-containing protein, partial [Myxococcota bacterium]
MNRRHFLGGMGAAGASLALAGLTGRVRAQTSGDYRALVCVFFGGGLDNWDTVVPYDDASHATYASLRASMFAANPGYRDRARLLPLDTSGFEGRRFALPIEMEGLHGLYGSGRAALVGNVGPLLEAVTRAGFEAGSARLPARLFSHNDQVSTWISGAPEGSAQFGWGGLFADASRAANGAPEFSAVGTGGGELFLTG